MFQLGNVPYVNARFELNFLLDQMATPMFEESLCADRLVMPFWTWQGPAHELVTDLMRRSIIGLESYVVGAARITAINSNQYSEELEQKLSNPFHLKARGAADAFYNKVPALIVKTNSLETANPELWTEISGFYQNTRNPLFHGSMINKAEALPLLSAHRLIARVYSWIDTWSTY